MTVINRSTGAPSGRRSKWNSIDWKTISRSVRRLQVRIAKAVREKKFGKANALQWLLTHSYHAKLLAIKRVTSNKGKRTPGVDNVTWTTPRRKINAVKLLKRRGYRPQPLRRIHIPKKNSSKKRPLSIPAMVDRAFQALYKLALEPVAETLADPNSYGFRPNRNCADAIAQCFIILSSKTSPRWILEADIKACFDEVSHSWVLANTPIDRQVTRKWLKSGYMENSKLYPTETGTPQGGIISPTIANMTLDGLETAAKSSVPKRKGKTSTKVNVIRYADDFIITGRSKDLLEQKVRPAVEAFLQERGLSLSKEKTRITKIEDGFNFLGQNLRKYGGKLLIKPAKESVKAFLSVVRRTIRKHLGSNAKALIKDLNSKIRGWANYHRHVVSGNTFSYVDTCIYKLLWQWMRRKHNNKSKDWMTKKYWMNDSRSWVFGVKGKNKKGQPCLFKLIKAGSIGVDRYIKVIGLANPYDPKYDEYFEDRKRYKTYGMSACSA